MQCKSKYQIWYSFLYSPENSNERSQKTDLLAFFQRFSDHTLLRPMVHAPIFFPMKVLMVIHTSGKFHQHYICGSQVTNFQMFSWQCSIHQIALFWEFLGLFSTKYSPNMLKLGPEVFHHKKKTVYEQYFKTKCLGTNGMYQKFTVLVHFWARFTLGKRKILPKTKITTFFGLSNYIIPKSQIDRRILLKIIKKTLFWGSK